MVKRTEKESILKLCDFSFEADLSGKLASFMRHTTYLCRSGSRSGPVLPCKGGYDDCCFSLSSRTLSRSLSATFSPLGRLPVSHFRTPLSRCSQQYHDNVSWRWSAPSECVLDAHDRVPAQSLLDKALIADILASLSGNPCI